MLKRQKHRSLRIGEGMDVASAGASPDAGDVAFPSALTGPGERSSSTRSNPSGRNRASNRAQAPRLSANEDVAAASSWDFERSEP